MYETVASSVASWNLNLHVCVLFMCVCVYRNPDPGEEEKRIVKTGSLVYCFAAPSLIIKQENNKKTKQGDGGGGGTRVSACVCFSLLLLHCCFTQANWFDSTAHQWRLSSSSSSSLYVRPPTRSVGRGTAHTFSQKRGTRPHRDVKCKKEKERKDIQGGAPWSTSRLPVTNNTRCTLASWAVTPPPASRWCSFCALAPASSHQSSLQVHNFVLFFLKFNFQLELDKKVRKFKTLLLLLHTVEYCAGTALGMESGRISDADISASSSYARSVGPEHARYKFASASLSL